MNMLPDMNSPLNQAQRLTLLATIFIFAMVAYASVDHTKLFLNCDSPWHIAAGDLIRDQGEVSTQEPWAFSTQDMGWYNLSWLYDIGVSWLYEWFGLSGLYTTNLVLCVLIVCLLTYTAVARGSSIFPAIIVSFLAIVMFRANLSIRPQIICLIPAMLSLLILYRYRLKQYRTIWLLPLITLFWANIHGSFLVMVTILGSFFLEFLLNKDYARAKTIFLVGIACLLATFVNPLGWEIYKGAWLSGGSSYMREFIVEWRPSSLSNEPRLYILLLIFLLMLFYTRIAVPLSERLLITFWLLMSFNVMRHSIWFAVFMLPLLSVMFHRAFEQSTGPLHRINNTLHEDFSKPATLKMIGGVASLLIIAVAIQPIRSQIIADDLYVADVYPVKEIDYLVENHHSQRVFNAFCYGSYMIYQSRGSIKQLMDSRVVTAYPIEVIEEHTKMQQFRPGWQDLAKKHQVTLALFPNFYKRAEVAFSEANWQPVFKGEVATVYQKQ